MEVIKIDGIKTKDYFFIASKQRVSRTDHTHKNDDIIINKILHVLFTVHLL